MTIEQVRGLLKYFVISYPAIQDKDLSGLADVWHPFLANIDARYGIMAANKIIATEIFFPATSVFIKTVMEIAQSESKIPSAHEAWEEILLQVKNYGSGRKKEWSHPIVEKAINQLGGLVVVCNSTKIAVERAHFYQIYESLIKQAKNAFLNANMQFIPSLLEGKFSLPESCMIKNKSLEEQMKELKEWEKKEMSGGSSSMERFQE